jgi:ligand-binding sensor domain-containing protein
LFSQIKFNKVVPPLGGFATLRGITQDKNGYMWFATQIGLFKYDGYHYTTYRNNPTDSNSLSSNYLQTVHADEKGLIWIGTESSGLDRLDPAMGKFTHFKFKAGDPGSIGDDNVKLIWEDREGVIWIGTGGTGLDKYDPTTGKFQHYRPQGQRSRQFELRQGCEHCMRIKVECFGWEQEVHGFMREAKQMKED